MGVFSAFCLVAGVLFTASVANAQEAEDESVPATEFEYVSPPEIGADDTHPEDPPPVDNGADTSAQEPEEDPLLAVHRAGDAAVFGGDQAGYEAAAAELRAGGRDDLAEGLDVDWAQLNDTSAADGAGSNVVAGSFGINGAACSFGSLQAAINAATPGQAVVIAPGNYSGINVNVNFQVSIVQGTATCGILPPLSLRNENNVILNGAGTNDAVIEVFGGDTVTLVDLTVAFGDGTDGNLRVFEDSTLRLNNVRSTSGTNSASGGGLLVEDGEAFIIGAAPGAISVRGLETRIDGNEATFNGGGIAVLADGELNGNRLIVTNNVADPTQTAGFGDFSVGGGLSVAADGSADVGLLTATRNTAPRGGGVGALGDVDLEQADISDNEAVGGGGIVTGAGGGLVVSSSGSADITGNSVISGNTSTDFGGGVTLQNSARVDITGSSTTQPRIIDNTAPNGGGVAVQGVSQLDLNTVEVTNNTATNNGGGAWVGDGADLDVQETTSCGAVGGVIANDVWCNEFFDNGSQGLGSAIYSDGGNVFVEQTAFIGHNGGTTIDVRNESITRVQNSLLVDNIVREIGDGVITARDTGTELTAIALTILENSTGISIDTDSATAVTSRILGDQRYGGGTYSGICNVSTDIGNMPGATLVTDLRLAGTLAAAHSEWEPLADSPALDVCAGNEGATTDIIDRGVDDANGIGGNQWDAGAYEVRTGFGYLCGGLNATIVGTQAGETINGTNGNDVIAAIGGDDTVNALLGNDTVCGGNGADTLNGQGGDDDLRGQGDDDILNGGDQNDIAFGGPGDDTLNGGNGTDDLRGQGGDDIVNGGNGVDNMLGQSGSDELRTDAGGNRGTTSIVQGGGGPDLVIGSPDDDELDGGFGQDEIRGGDGDDILNGGNAGDDLFGGDGADILNGNSGNDDLFGGDQNDELNGGPDNDDLFGESGNDALNGQSGTDLCDGGSGAGDTVTPQCETNVDIP